MSKHNDHQPSLPLPAAPPDERIFLNSSVWMVDRDGHRAIFCRHEPLFRIPLGDQVHLRLAAVTLRLSKTASQQEIAKAFGHSVATQRRWEDCYQHEQLQGLTPKRSPGREPTLDATHEELVRRWFEAGGTNREIARRLAVGEATVRRTLRRLGLKRPESPQRCLGLEDEETSAEAGEGETSAKAGQEETLTKAAEEETTGVDNQSRPRSESADAASIVSEAQPARLSETLTLASRESSVAGEEMPGEREDVPLGVTIDRDPMDRSGDRAMARMGMLEDALPLFADAEAVPRAGVLLAMPLLTGHGLLEAFQKVYGPLGPAFYGLRTMVVTLFLCALLRIKRPEHLKEYSPESLGRIVGLDRMPEVKTVRRKLTQMAALGRAGELLAALARSRIEAKQQRVAFLYLDGHVREYHGQFPLAKAKKPQRQVVTPAVTDTWVHDADGEPLLVVNHEINAKLTQVLEPILEDVRRLVPDRQRRITALFDRGGFSPKLFARLTANGFDVITYRKGKSRKLPRSSFSVQGKQIDGAWREYELCERPRVRVGKRTAQEVRDGEGKYFWMREIRVLRKDGRQTSILTNRDDLEAVEVAYRIFGRWRQENYLKYMGQEFDLDALVEYGAEEVSAEVDRPNPRRKALQKRLQEARAEVVRLRAELGEKLSQNEESKCRTVRGFKTAHAALRRQLAEAEARVAKLARQRSKLPQRVPACELNRLPAEKKRIVDAIKMAAYQVETELLGMLPAHYARTVDEGRTLLHAVFQSSAKLEVAEGELRVTIAAQSSPHRTAAVAALCKELNARPTTFPGTALRLRLAVAPHKTAHFPEGVCQEF